MRPQRLKILKLGLISFSLAIIGLGAVIIFVLPRHYLVPILMYHSIGEDIPDKDNLLSISVSSFEKEMKFLKDRKFNVISLEDLADYIDSGLRLPRNSVVVTFDDGYKDNFILAFPLLKKYNIPATIFICPLLISQEPDYLTWTQVKKLASSPLIDIGSHGLSHAYLPDIKDQRQLSYQIKTSKILLGEILNVPIKFFSYPAGGFTKKIRQMVIDSGYRGAVATKPGRRYPDNDIFALKRMRISEHNKNLFVFWVKLTGFYVPLREWQRRHKDKDIYTNIISDE